MVALRKVAMHLRRPIIGVVSAWACVAFLAASVMAQPLSYGGLGARVASFDAQNRHGTGKPPVGVAYYRVTGRRLGRVSAFEAVVNANPKYSSLKLFTLLTGKGLPADAGRVQTPKRDIDGGYCEIYKSRWLGRVIGLPYAVMYVSRPSQMASVMASLVPACRG